MSKNLLQDMLKIKQANREARGGDYLEKTRYENAEYFTAGGQNGNKPRHTLWLVAIVSIGFFLFSVSFLFSKVVVTVNPKIKNVVLNENLSAIKGGGKEDLSFDVIAVSGEENITIKVSGEKDVSEKARGVVVIYNTFSSKTQRLDIDTRLEGSNGKIYKTVKQIVVPGMKDNVPGSIEVGIYAMNAGVEYNSGPLDFTVFGFKGTPKYSKFYARSKGEITGGFKGKAPVVSDAEKLNTINNLKKTLQVKLFKKAVDQVPKGFILFKDAIFLNTNESSIDFTFHVPSEGDILPVKLEGTLYGLLFNEEKLAKKIAKDKISDYDSSAVYISNIQNLIFTLSNKDSTSLGDVKNINFNLSGTAKIVWKLDENKLKTDLLGKSKKYFSQILLQYPNVDSADLSISPFWKMSLPNKAKEIKVIVNYPK